MTKKNPILTTIDYEKEGKQTGYLRLPHSVHRSAYGWLPFPVASLSIPQLFPSPSWFTAPLILK